MKNVLLLLLLLFTIGCNSSKIKISTNPAGSTISYDSITETTPVEINIEEDKTYLIQQEGYNSKNISGSELLSLKQKEIVIELNKRKYPVSFDVTSNSEIYLNNHLQKNKNLYIEQGTHKVVVKRPGFWDFTTTIDVPETNSVTPSWKRSYIIKTIPESVTNLTLNSKIVPINKRFDIKRVPAIMEFKLNGIKINTLLQNGNITSEGVVKIDEILDKYNQIMPNNREIDITSSWVNDLDTPPLLSNLILPATGFEDVPDSITGENRLITSPLYYYSHISIANPTEDIIGATVTVHYNKHEKTYHITEDFYTNNLKKTYTNQSVAPDYMKQEFLKIDDLNIDAPFNRGVLNITLSGSRIKEDMVELEIGKDIKRRVGDNRYGVYSQKLSNIFEDNIKKPSDTHYLYADKSLEDHYLIIYQVDNSIYKPVKINYLQGIDEKPAEIKLSNTLYNYFVLIIDDISSIKNWSVFSLKMLKSKD